MIGAPANDGKGVPGWYEFSTVVNGRLHPFIRCPYPHAEWCGSILSLAWARDGTRIASSLTSVRSNRPIQRPSHRHPGNQTRPLEALLVDPPMGTPSNLEWAPDGSKLVFDASGSIYVLSRPSCFRLTASADRRSRAGPSTIRHRGLRTERVSSSRPSGTKLFVHLGDRPGRWSPRRLIATHASAPAWSPDGTTIAYRNVLPCGIKLVTPRWERRDPGESALRVSRDSHSQETQFGHRTGENSRSSALPASHRPHS